MGAMGLEKKSCGIVSRPAGKLVSIGGLPTRTLIVQYRGTYGYDNHYGMSPVLWRGFFRTAPNRPKKAGMPAHACAHACFTWNVFIQIKSVALKAVGLQSRVQVRMNFCENDPLPIQKSPDFFPGPPADRHSGHALVT